MRPGQAVAVALISLALYVWPTPATAHAFAQRYDLPLPLGFYLAGAGLAVAVSFLGSFLFLRERPPLERALRIPLPDRLCRIGRAGLRTISVMLLGVVLATAFFGPESATRNFATVFVWVIWWVGFVLFSALVVDLWTTAGPFTTIARALLGHPPKSPPAAAGWGWIAVVGLIAISWLELVSDAGEDPHSLGWIVLGYSAVFLTGWRILGPERTKAADPLSVLFRTLGHAAPTALTRSTVVLRLPGAGLVGRETTVPGAVLIICLIAIVLFDGLSETPIWASVLEWVTQSRALRPWLLDLRNAGFDILKTVRTVGLVSVVAMSLALYLMLSAAVRGAAGGIFPTRVIFRSFAASLLPIAVAYHLAHYASYLALAGQLALPALSDPFGLGWDLLGAANRPIDLGVVNAEDVWWIAAISLVTGHTVAVVVAHAEALAVFPDRRLAIRSQIPMMVFMVALTSFSLWVLSQPIVA